MEKVDKNQSDSSKQDIEMAIVLKNQYGLEINIQSDIQFEINEALKILEKTQIGKCLFIEISKLMKIYENCLFLLTTDSKYNSEMYCPTKENGTIILSFVIYQF